MLFIITTGRSGTAYLAHSLNLLKNFKAEHESVPAFHDYYRKILNGQYIIKIYVAYIPLVFSQWDVSNSL